MRICRALRQIRCNLPGGCGHRASDRKVFPQTKAGQSSCPAFRVSKRRHTCFKRVWLPHAHPAQKLWPKPMGFPMDCCKRVPSKRLAVLQMEFFGRLLFAFNWRFTLHQGLGFMQDGKPMLWEPCMVPHDALRLGAYRAQPLFQHLFICSGTRPLMRAHRIADAQYDIHRTEKIWHKQLSSRWFVAETIREH